MNRTVSGFATSDEAEQAFYNAFSMCDQNAMSAVWADDKVVCIHPGSNAIYGYESVMRSWTHILNNAQLPRILFNTVKKTVNESLAVHLVEEHIASGQGAVVVILATNIYQQLENGWLMIEHHGSVTQSHAETHTVQ